MIKSLQLVNFKNFSKETLEMGPFTVIVGTNASGKSNIRDAFRFLHGVGRGYSLSDIIGGKYGAGGQAEWEQMRGAADEIVRFGQSTFSLKIDVDIPRRGKIYRQPLRYEIEVGVDKEKHGMFRVMREELKDGRETIYTSHPPEGDPVRFQDDDMHLLLRMGKTGAQRKYGHRIAIRPNQPALTQIQEHKRIVRPHKARAKRTRDILASMRFLDLSPERIRQPAFPGQTILGDHGENLPTVLREVDRKQRETLVEWTRELTPMDVRDFAFPTDPTTGRVQLAFQEANGRIVSAYAASDGTLRFLAMLAALLGTNPARLYVFEEIDNGIHPSRLRLLVELIESQTSKKNIQVVTTTHSPDLLSMIGNQTFKNTSVVCRCPDTEDAIVRPVEGLPNAKKIRRSQGLGRLHASGWMENAILFHEASRDDQGQDA